MRAVKAGRFMRFATSSLTLEGRHANPDTLAFLARTPTRQRFPIPLYTNVYRLFFRHTRVFKTHRHAVYQCLFKTRVFAHLNSFVLVFFMWYRTIIARYVAKWGIAQMRLCKAKYQGGVSHHFGGVLASLKKYRAIWGIAAIVSQYRTIWGH